MDSNFNIKFITKDKKFNSLKIPEEPIGVSKNTKPDDLNTIFEQWVNSTKKFNFCFLINGIMLQVSLAKFVKQNKIDPENIIEIECIERCPPPAFHKQIEQPYAIRNVRVNGNWILAGNFGETIDIYAVNGESLLKISENTSHVMSVDWIDVEDNYGYFATGSYDETVRTWRWNIKNNTYECLSIGKGHVHQIETLCVSPQKDFIASGSYDKLVKVWPISMEKMRSQCVESEADSAEPKAKKAKISKVATKAKKSNRKTCESVVTLDGHKASVYAVRWTRQPNVICTASNDLTIKFWDLNKCGMQTEIVSGNPFNDLDYSPFNNLLLTASYEPFVRLYDTRSDNLEWKINARYSSHTNIVKSVRWSKRNENLFVSGGFDNQVKLWDLRTFKCPLYDLNGHSKSVYSVDWSNPKYIASSGSDGKINVYKTDHIV